MLIGMGLKEFMVARDIVFKDTAASGLNDYPSTLPRTWTPLPRPVPECLGSVLMAKIQHKRQKVVDDH